MEKNAGFWSLPKQIQKFQGCTRSIQTSNSINSGPHWLREFGISTLVLQLAKSHTSRTACVFWFLPQPIRFPFGPFRTLFPPATLADTLHEKRVVTFSRSVAALLSPSFSPGLEITEKKRAKREKRKKLGRGCNFELTYLCFCETDQVKRRNVWRAFGFTTPLI